MAAGQSSDAPRGPRLRSEVEHGLDERYLALHGNTTQFTASITTIC